MRICVHTLIYLLRHKHVDSYRYTHTGRRVRETYMYLCNADEQRFSRVCTYRQNQVHFTQIKIIYKSTCMPIDEYKYTGT